MIPQQSPRYRILDCNNSEPLRMLPKRLKHIRKRIILHRPHVPTRKITPGRRIMKTPCDALNPYFYFSLSHTAKLIKKTEPPKKKANPVRPSLKFP